MAAPGSGGWWRRAAETRVGRWWRALLQDYAEAARDAARGARSRPARAAAAALLALGAAACARSAPDAASFDAALLQAAERLLLLPPALRRPDAERHVGRLLRLRAAGRLRHRDAGLAALLLEAPARAEAAPAAPLRPRWRDLPARVLDVGFLGRWWVLAARGRRCDVNDEEFRALPPRLRGLSARQLRSERNERLFQEKFRPVVLSAEEVRRAEEEDAAQRQAGGPRGDAQ